MQIMPFEEAKTYRFNPIDLTRAWPHAYHPLIEVGKLTLNQSPTGFHTQIEKSAFASDSLVRGFGLSPDKMLLGRSFSYSDTLRARLGANCKQIPVNRAKSPVHSYSKDGAMRVDNVSDPACFPILEVRPTGLQPVSRFHPQLSCAERPIAQSWRSVRHMKATPRGIGLSNGRTRTVVPARNFCSRLEARKQRQPQF